LFTDVIKNDDIQTRFPEYCANAKEIIFTLYRVGPDIPGGKELLKMEALQEANRTYTQEYIEQGRAEGRAEGRVEGLEKAMAKVAAAMLKDPVSSHSQIIRYTKLSEKELLDIADKLKAEKLSDEELKAIEKNLNPEKLSGKK
jgi:predicted transposase YdaD